MQQSISFVGNSSQEVDAKVNAWLREYHEVLDVVERSMCMTTTIVGDVIHKTTIWYQPVFPPHGVAKPVKREGALS